VHDGARKVLRRVAFLILRMGEIVWVKLLYTVILRPWRVL